PSLSFPLRHADGADDLIAEWQSWARVLKLPLLVTDADGSLREPFPHLGALRIGEPVGRRRRRSSLRRRRPSILLRRKPGRPGPTPYVHRAEREIIARH